MKSILKYFYIILFLGAVTLSACSDDDPTQEEQKHEQPDKPNDDDPNDLNSDSSILGEWTSHIVDYGSLYHVGSTSLIVFTKDSITVNWHYKSNTSNSCSVVKGKYTVLGDSLKVEWKNVMTDTIVNTAFNTLYLAGEYSIKNDRMNYNYSVYDISGGKLSGPHPLNLSKNK